MSAGGGYKLLIMVSSWIWTSLLILFYTDQVIKQDSGDYLQESLHSVNEICEEYNTTVSINKTKIMALLGKEPTRFKIVLQDKVLELRFILLPSGLISPMILKKK